MTEQEIFFKHAIQLLDRLEKFLDGKMSSIRFDDENTDCWQYSAGTNCLKTVSHVADVSLDDLKCIDRLKQALVQNTSQFINGLPANNALLWGPRGTGKSSLIKAVFNGFRDQGLKLIEVRRTDLVKLPEISELLYDRPGRFIIFCDDLSFEENDPGYKSIKVILDGSISQTPENVLIYASSNRRHLIPERISENLQSEIIDGDLHLSETIEEKLSLSERFGIWLAFHPFNQEQYLQIVSYWLGKLGVQDLENKSTREQALQWALQHGSRSGRSAVLFARDHAGKTGLGGI